MSRCAVTVLVLLAACRKDAEPAATSPEPSRTTPAIPDAAVARHRPWPSRWDPVAIEPRFAELRDARSLRCLIARGDDDGLAGSVVEDAPALVARIAAFAMVEAARRNGESPTLDALADAVHMLIEVDDIDGLRLAFDEADRIPLPPRWQHPDVVYRARAGLPLSAADRNGRPEAVRELALAGELTAATAMYDHEIIADQLSKYDRPAQIGALVALGRLDAARALIEQASPEDRLGLAVAWLDTAIRARARLEVAVAVVIDEGVRRPSGEVPYQLIDTLRVARRAGLIAELRLVRERLLAVVKDPRIDVALFQDAVLRGDDVVLAVIGPTLDPVERERVIVLDHGRLDDALAWALDQESSTTALARIWVRHVVEGADPGFEAKMAAALCP